MACNATTGASIGYLTTATTYGIYGGGHEPNTSTPADLLSVTVPVGSQVSIATNNGNSTYPWASGGGGSADLGANSSYLFFLGTDHTAPGATPTVVGDARGGGYDESSIWTLSANGSLVPQWINQDGSTPPTHLYFDDESGDGSTDYVGMTGNVAAFQAQFPNEHVSAMTLTLDPDGTATCPGQTSSSSVTLEASPTTSTFGESVSFTATVTGNGGGVPTGTVDFTADGDSINAACDAATVSTASGVTTATCTTSDLAVGTTSVTASYSGDSSFTGSDSDPLSYAVGKATPNVSLSVDPIAGSTVGDSVTLTTTLTGVDAADPTGTVAFQSNDTSISPACDAAPVSTSGGVTTATCTTTGLAQGTDSLTASYSGDGNYTAGDLQSTSYVVSGSALPTPTVTLAGSPAAGSAFGQSVTFTATVATESGTPTGSVKFEADGASIGCDAKSLSTSSGTTTATCTTSALAVGSHSVTAHYLGDANDSTADAPTLTYAVAKASTSTDVTVGSDSLTAAVAPVSPGAGTPTGTVEFSVDGSPVGTAPVTGGTATLTYTVPAGAEHAVAAVYSGDGNFTGSSDSTSRSNPTITGHITSAHAKSAAGWYRSPVTVTFTCTTTSADLTAPCPGPVTRHRNTAAGSVTATIHATDGGVASVTVPYKLDKHRPTIKVTGVKSGKSYAGAGPTPNCVATDKLSGVAACGLKLKHHGHVVRYVAQAIDKAGNKSRKIHGHYKIHQP